MGDLGTPRTALDFAREGVRFTRAAGRVAVYGPPAKAHLLGLVRAEVERRMPRLAGHTMLRTRSGYGVCETCGDEMAAHVAGMCDLCVIARCKALGGGFR